MAWGKERIQLDNGQFSDTPAPEIVSASRSTDIPAFYADWWKPPLNCPPHSPAN